MSKLLRSSGAFRLCSHASRVVNKTPLRCLSSLPISVLVSPREVSSKTLTWQNLERATRALHRDGLVVLEDVIDHDRLDMLNAKMAEDASILQSAGDAGPYNYNKGFVHLP